MSNLTLKQQLEFELADMTNSQLESFLEYGMSASGNWERQLEYVVSETPTNINGKILASDYTKYLTEGLPPNHLIARDILLEWMSNKNIENKIFQNGTELVDRIQQAIFERGTTWYQRGGTDMVSRVINEKSLNVILQRLAISQQFTTNILKYYTDGN